MVVMEKLLGEQNYEKILKKSKNPKIIRLLSTIAALRFLGFPITIVLLIAVFIFTTIMLLFNTLAATTGYVYRMLIDSSWLKLEWFNLSLEEIKDEYIRVGGKLIDGELG